MRVSRLKKHYTDKYIIATASVLLLAGAVGLVHPFVPDNSYAGSKNTDINLKIGEAIMVPEVSTDTINITLDPTAAGGDFKTAAVDVSVSTNRTSGYTLTMSTEDTDTDLTNTTYTDYAIEALSSTTSSTNFADLTHSASMNKWGYATNNNGEGEGQTTAGYYYAMADINDPAIIKITDGPSTTVENTTTTVTFATKGKDLAAGQYQNTVVFSVVGNAIPEPVSDLSTATNMQDDDIATKCAGSEATTSVDDTTTYELVDARNNEPYYIRKFTINEKDYCMMVENLYLVGGTKLTEITSDVSSDYTLPTSTTSGYYTSNTTHQMYNGGSSASAVRHRYGATYDGSYYSWCAATANTGGCYNKNTNGSSGVTEATSSICPKHWRLFTSDERDAMATAINSIGINTFFADKDGEPTSPIYPGRYYNSSRSYDGSYASWWSSTQNSAANARFLYAYGGSLYTNNRSKYYGYSVRCVLPAA